MSHQEPISMRDPKFVSVAARVFPLPKKYFYSGPKKVTTTFRKNKSGILLENFRLLPKGKEIPFRQGKAIPTSKTRKHGGTTAQTKVKKTHIKSPKKISKPRRRPHGSLTASDLWRLNRSSHKFTKTMGRKGREGRQVNKKVSNNIFY